MRADFLVLLYRHNRLAEALKLIDSLKIDAKTFNDTFYQRIILEYNGRILIKQGKHEEAKKKFQEAITVAKQYFHNDPGLVILYGDFGELL